MHLDAFGCSFKKEGMYFPGPRRQSPKIPQLLAIAAIPARVSEVQKRRTKPGWSERQLPKMPLGGADVHLADEICQIGARKSSKMKEHPILKHGFLWGSLIYLTTGKG